MGGSEMLAQRIWLTLLFSGAGLGAIAFLRALGLRPAAAACGAMVYLFNAHTLDVVPNDVYLCAFLLLPALPAIVLNAAMGRIRVTTAAVIIALSVPILGYAALNPPLVLMLGTALVASPVLALWLGGWSPASRALKAIGLGGALVMGLSAYWIVPTAIVASHAASGELSNLTSWAWTEGRSSIINAFWLNTSWGWDHPEYAPYAKNYNAQPLLFLKFALPAFAFAALGLARSSRQATGGDPRPRNLRIAVAMSAAALFLILLSNGTNSPGSALFVPLYQLPLGWLLREPGRFLVAGALAYAVLAAVTIEEIAAFSWNLVLTRWHGLHALSGRWKRLISVRLTLAGALVLAASLASGYPLVTGAVIPGDRQLLPPGHVRFPDYWKDMAFFIDAATPEGPVIALPADIFYQLPFSWGYYGSDSFMLQLMNRHIIAPVPQGYINPSQELSSVVGLIEKAALAFDWPQVQRLSQILDAPLILVRGDVAPGALGSRLTPPGEISAALSEDPDVQMIHQSGPLQLFAFRGHMPSKVAWVRDYATVESPEPDLDILQLLPPGMHLVSAPARPGVSRVELAPPVESWREQTGRLTTSIGEPPGWDYHLALLPTRESPGSVSDLSNGGSTAAVGGLEVTQSDGMVHITVPVTNKIDNGDFSKGLWREPGDCGQFYGRDFSGIRAAVLPSAGPSGAPVMVLSAQLDSACEFEKVHWNGNPLVVSLDVRHVSGDAPRLCLYETNLSKCASAPDFRKIDHWTRYRFLVTPDAGTSSLQMFLYSDGDTFGPPTVNEFANVEALELPVVPHVGLIGIPSHPNPEASGSNRSGLISSPLLATEAAVPSLSLLIQHEAFDQAWQGPANSTHVVVDGLFNGWLGASASQRYAIHYRLATVIIASRILSAGVAGGVVVMLLSWALPVARRWRRRASSSVIGAHSVGNVRPGAGD
jgi:hypothetical protein